MLCAHRNAHSSVVGVVNEIIIIIIITSKTPCLAMNERARKR